MGPTPLERSKTTAVRELQATMVAAQEQLRPFCLSETPRSFPGCSFLYVLHVCYRPLLERFAPSWWNGFEVELSRLGGPSGVLTLLTIARIDTDGTGDIDEAEHVRRESTLCRCGRLSRGRRRPTRCADACRSCVALGRLKEFDRVAQKLILDTCDALQTSAVVASLLFGATFQSVIGRPTFMVASEATVERWGDDAAEAIMWVAYATMMLISVLCLIVIFYAFGSRMELQNVLPSVQSRLFYLCEVNPMNAVTAMTTLCMLVNHNGAGTRSTSGTRTHTAKSWPPGLSTCGAHRPLL